MVSLTARLTITVKKVSAVLASFSAVMMSLSDVNGLDVVNQQLDLFDKTRQRSIPVEIYTPAHQQSRDVQEPQNSPFVLINHGYGVKNTEYSFLANALVNEGFFVVSIQHDLDTDLPLPRVGDLFQKRKPFWERGVLNILFTISEIKKIYLYFNFGKVILMGHSNGGDMAMMFTEQYSEFVEKVISLDSLRYPFPFKKGVPILSLRANDTMADEGVLPESIPTTMIVPLKEAKHIHFSDRGGKELKQKISDIVLIFIKSPITF